MQKGYKILFPTDFSRCANQALSIALQLAKLYAAELHMLHAIVLHDDDPHNPAYHFPDVEEIHKKLRELAYQEMDSTIAAFPTENVKIIQKQLRGITAAPIILEYAADNNIDLIVMGTHGRRGIEHFLLGSVAEEVIRLAPCPVLTVRERAEPSELEQVHKILVPVDFSDYSVGALKSAYELAQRFSARLQLLHVIEEILHPAFYAGGIKSVYEMMPEIQLKVTQAMQELVKKVIPDSDVEVDFHVIEGQAGRDIVKFAKEQASDLIVIATHGLTGIEHLVLGSVAEKVVRRAPCPVFTMKKL